MTIRSRRSFAPALATVSPLGVLMLVLALGVTLAAGPSLADDAAAASPPHARAHPDAESVQPLAVGQRVPAARVRTIDGAPVDLASLTRESGALLVFYRGGW